MVCVSCMKLWGSEFDDIVSKKDKMQDININQIKLKVNNAYKEDEKISTNFEPLKTQKK